MVAIAVPHNNKPQDLATKPPSEANNGEIGLANGISFSPKPELFKILGTIGEGDNSLTVVSLFCKGPDVLLVYTHPQQNSKLQPGEDVPDSLIADYWKLAEAEQLSHSRPVSIVPNLVIQPGATEFNPWKIDPRGENHAAFKRLKFRN